MPSTQGLAKEAARGGARGGTVFVTDYQSDGRGRRDRSWRSAPRVDLTFSAIFRLDVETRHAHTLNFAAALAVAAALEKNFPGSGGRVSIKWPNDVLADARKICGIICESSGTREKLDYAVLGIGINVNRREDELPCPDSSGRPRATSVLAAFGEKMDLPRLLADVLNELEPRSSMASDDGGRKRLMAEYRAKCSTIGREVRIISDDGENFGVAADITDGGELVLTTGGEFTLFNSADVVHARVHC
jgi:BirA family biotin operon repressor/biotin-[acetyl-CoA-carboxylase] ligase